MCVWATNFLSLYNIVGSGTIQIVYFLVSDLLHKNPIRAEKILCNNF